MADDKYPFLRAYFEDLIVKHGPDLVFAIDPVSALFDDAEEAAELKARSAFHDHLMTIYGSR